MRQRTPEHAYEFSLAPRIAFIIRSDALKELRSTDSTSRTVCFVAYVNLGVRENTQSGTTLVPAWHGRVIEERVDKIRAMTWFCRTAEAKSFAGAANSLDVVPSAVSKTIAALETELGIQLVNRSTTRFSLTHEGELYYERCRSMLQELEDVEAAMRGSQTGPRGVLRVGMHPALRVVLLSTLGAFLASRPELKVETVVTNSAAAVIDEGLDVVMRIGRLADSNLVARSLGRVQSIVCASPDYLESAGTPEHPGDLAKHHAIIYGRRDEASNAEWTFTRGTESVAVSVPVRIVVRDGIGVTDAAVGGAGVALPLDISVRHLLKSQALRALLPGWSGQHYPVFAVTPGGRGSVPAKVRAYVDFFAAILEKS